MFDNRLASILMLSVREGSPLELTRLVSRHWHAVGGDGLPPGVDHAMTAFSLRFGLVAAARAFNRAGGSLGRPVDVIFALTRAQLRPWFLWTRAPRREWGEIAGGARETEIQAIRLFEHHKQIAYPPNLIRLESARGDWIHERRERAKGLHDFLLERGE